MLSLFRSVMLLGAIEWALLAVSVSPWLKAYFRAQLVYTLLLGVLLAVNAEPWIYEMWFTVLTLCILVTATGFLWECLKEHDAKWIVLIQSLVLPNVLIVGAYNGLKASTERIPSYIWISLGMSAILMTLGIALSTVAILTERKLRVPAVTLSLLWLMQGAYQYGFSLAYQSHEHLWRLINEFVPATLVIVAFLVIGWRQRCIE
jgi:hypothetical protein